MNFKTIQNSNQNAICCAHIHLVITVHALAHVAATDILTTSPSFLFFAHFAHLLMSKCYSS